MDLVSEAGFGDRIIGVAAAGVAYEADKIAGKRSCEQAGVPVAPAWAEVEARDYPAVLKTCLAYLHEFGGAVLKFPYSAGGKGARIMLNTWDVKEVYDVPDEGLQGRLQPRSAAKNPPGPCSSRPACPGWKSVSPSSWTKRAIIKSFPPPWTTRNALTGPPGLDNPITGGMGSISPHPLESPALLELADATLARPLIRLMEEQGTLRPCVLYPGCFASFDADFRAQGHPGVRNQHPSRGAGIPARGQTLAQSGGLGQAMAAGNLDEVAPEVRSDQVSLCLALVTGPGGPKQQKGYPWSLTKGEVVEMDFDYCDKKKITVIPSAMDYADGVFKSDGSRVAYLLANATVKAGQTMGQAAETLRQKLLNAFDNGKIRVIPRENESGNRLALRRDIGVHFQKAEALKSRG